MFVSIIFFDLKYGPIISNIFPLKEASSLKCKIITTEKDYERIKNENYKEIKFIKTELKILDEDKFIQSII